MPRQAGRRNSKSFVIVDENYDPSTTATTTPRRLGSHRRVGDAGPLAPTDPNRVLLSMSGYADKPQEYNDNVVYEYEAATRPQESSAYPGLAAHPIYTPVYHVDPQMQQIPVGLPQNTADFSQLAPAQQCGTYDSAYYAAPNVGFPAYNDSGSRPLPQLISYEPNQGQQSTKLTVYIRSAYDLDNPPVKAAIMFGRTRCEGIMQKTAASPDGFEYAISASAPAFDPTSSISPQLPLQLVFEDGSVPWDENTLDFGHFTYLDDSLYSSPDLTSAGLKKRKLSGDASPRRSPGKKPSMHHLRVPANVPAAPLPSNQPYQQRKPSSSDNYPQSRYAGSGYQISRNDSIADVQAPQSYGASPAAGQPTPSLQSTQSPSWSYFPQVPSNTRSPSIAALSAPSKTPQLLPSPMNVQNPPLIRTSTIHPPPTHPVVVHRNDPSSYMPFPVYGAKAELTIEGELDAMAKSWTPVEREAGRRLVQFQRAQTGNVITTSFAPVTLEERIPNGICVSCIWWEGKGECYVTSVDTIALLESLVGVRFTVEEKNRIRRNLEGYRPTTVAKGKPDSDVFFKLIMGFPNPKPRNIEKDVKVFPWRILPRALTKIIGKYSASYSSTAGALPTAVVPIGAPPHPSYTHSSAAARPTASSPHSTSSSAGSHHNHAYTAAMMTTAGGGGQHQPYSPRYGMVSASHPSSSGPVLAASHHHPQQQHRSQHPATTTPWHQQQQPLVHYTHDMAGAGRSSAAAVAAATAAAWDLSARGGAAVAASGYLPANHHTGGFIAAGGAGAGANASTIAAAGGGAYGNATPRMAAIANVGEMGLWMQQQQQQHPPSYAMHPHGGQPAARPQQQQQPSQQQLAQQQMQQQQQSIQFQPFATQGHPATSTS